MNDDLQHRLGALISDLIEMNTNEAALIAGTLCAAIGAVIEGDEAVHSLSAYVLQWVEARDAE